MPRLGDALLYMKAKQDCPYGCPGAVLNGRKFNLLGDPSMQYGMAAAGSVVLFVIVMCFTLLNWLLGRRAEAV